MTKGKYQMNDSSIFPPEEYEARLQNVRRSMEENDIDACLISSPENIYYLIGLSYQGYFVPHILIVPIEGEMRLITRAMEKKTIDVQVKNARFIGHGDRDDPGKVACQTIAEMGLGSARLGIEKSTLFLTPRVFEGIVDTLPKAHWIDASGLIDKIRITQSPLELEYTRKAAVVSDAAIQAGIDAAAVGVSEKEVAAKVYNAMILAGGEHPGFIPLIRSAPTLGECHVTWSERKLRQGDPLFLELGGCVRRYHAPMGRLLFLGEAPHGSLEMEKVALEAFNDVVNAILPGATAGEVYKVWRKRLDGSGLSQFQLEHCGYITGIGFPPSWCGGSKVIGIRRDSNSVLQPGMVFHLMTWLIGSCKGDYFVSDTGVLTGDGCEVLTKTSRHMHIV